MESKSWRVVELHEREAKVFPREELISDKGQSLVLPETRALSAVDLRDTPVGIELRAQGVVGYLPLTRSLVLNVRPKFPVENLWHMLATAEHEFDEVLEVLRGYAAGDRLPPHLLLARSFARFVRSIVASGVARGYYARERHGTYTPKVNFSKTLSYLARGDEIKVVADSFVFGRDLPSNQLLKSACLAFLRLMPRNDSWDADRTAVADCLHCLISVTPRQLGAMSEVDARDVLVWIRGSYKGALQAYAMLCGKMQIGFAFAATGIAMQSFLFCLDDVFEQFIRNTFRRALRPGIAVLDGNYAKHQRPLFVDNKRYPVKPDLIFSRNKRPIAIAEVKYKPKVDESDRYQLISHVLAVGVPFGVWISPAHTAQEQGLEYIGSISGGARFYHYRVDISQDLALSTSEMTSRVGRMLL